MGSGALAFDAAWLFAGLLAIIVLAAAFLASRRYLLERGGGTVECGLRRPAAGAPWRLGVASYQLEELRWFTAFGISNRADEVFGRRAMTVVARRSPEEAEAEILGPGRIIVECSVAGQDSVELALSDSALTGLLAWLEAAPPRYMEALAFSGLLPASLPVSVYRSPPGFQSTSPCSALATRPRMNSRSESRLRYFAGITLTVWGCSATAAHALRSARRVTVRATCSSVAPGVPPGRMKLRSTGRSSLNSSHSVSSLLM